MAGDQKGVDLLGGSVDTVRREVDRQVRGGAGLRSGAVFGHAHVQADRSGPLVTGPDLIAVCRVRGGGETTAITPLRAMTSAVTPR